MREKNGGKVESIHMGRRMGAPIARSRAKEGDKRVDTLRFNVPTGGKVEGGYRGTRVKREVDLSGKRKA